MSKNNGFIKKMTDWKVMIIIQSISTAVLIGLILKFGALPLKYTLGLIAILVLLLVGEFFLMRPLKEESKGKIRSIVGKITSLILSILLLLTSSYVAQGNSLVNSISGANKQTTRFSIIVLNDSKVEKISDLKDTTIESCTSLDKTTAKDAFAGLRKELPSITSTEVSDFSTLAKDLYDKKTEAIFLNEAYINNIENVYENFSNETRVIWSFDIQEELNDISRNVDVTDKPFVVYISGIDTSGPVSTVSRSDVNMVVTINPQTKQILMTSIPRDCYVTLADMQKKDKLTHSGLTGVENTVKTVEGFLDIEINYYARVNFTSLIKIVDALDGITVDIPKNFRSNADGSYFKKGTQEINGKQALAFSRERYAFSDGDNARVHNQQVVLTAMLNKMMSPAVIKNYTQVLKAIDGSFETNMSSKEITDLIQMQLNDMATWEITQKQIDGEGKTMKGGAHMPGSALYYMIPNEKSVTENKQAIQAILNPESKTEGTKDVKK